MRNLLFALTGVVLGTTRVAAKAKPQVPGDMASTLGYLLTGFAKGGAAARTAQPVRQGEVQQVKTSASALTNLRSGR